MSVLSACRPFVLLAFGALAACSAHPAITVAPNAPAEHTITVDGVASLEIVPDEACIELTLAARDPAMPAAHGRLREGGDALLKELAARTGLVVEGGTVAYEPEYESDGHGRTHLVGHIASQQINVRTRDFARIPEVVGLAAARGLDRVGVVYYSTAIVAQKAELRAQALGAARDKARAMAKKLDVALGDVVTIVEGEAHAASRVSVNNYLARGESDSAPDVPAPPGAIPLFMRVGVIYKLE